MKTYICYYRNITIAKLLSGNSIFIFWTVVFWGYDSTFRSTSQTLESDRCPASKKNIDRDRLFGADHVVDRVRLRQAVRFICCGARRAGTKRDHRQYKNSTRVHMFWSGQTAWTKTGWKNTSYHFGFPCHVLWRECKTFRAEFPASKVNTAFSTFKSIFGVGCERLPACCVRRFGCVVRTFAICRAEPFQLCNIWKC